MSRVLAVATSLPKTCVRQFTTTSGRCSNSSLARLKRKQALFQDPNDVPVYLKGGPMDYVLFYTSIALVCISLGMASVSTYKLIRKS